MMIAYYVVVAVLAFLLILMSYYRKWFIAVPIFLVILVSVAYFDIKLVGTTQNIYYAQHFFDKKYKVIYGGVYKKEEIYFLLYVGDEREPLYVSVPYTEQFNEQFQRAMQKARDNRQSLYLDLKKVLAGMLGTPGTGQGRDQKGTLAKGPHRDIDTNDNARYMDADPFYSPPPPKTPDKQIPQYEIHHDINESTIYHHQN